MPESSVSPVVSVLVEEAGQALRSTWDHPASIRLQDVIQVWGRHTVLRCRVKNGPAGAPDFVIVKAANDRTKAMNREHAALTLLNAIPAVAAHLPALYAADDRCTMLVVEDLGTGPSLGQLLRARADWAREALIEHMRLLALVQSRTRGLQHRYAVLSGGVEDPSAATLALPRLVDSLAATLTELGIDEAALPHDELHEVATRMAATPDETCLTFDDQCPANRIMSNGVLRIIDLETATFRHPFTDGAFPLIGQLSCMDGLRLPPDLVDAMMTAYRTGVAEAYPDLVDARRFGPDMASACAMSLIALLSGVGAARRKDGVVGHYLITRRQRILAAAHAFTAAATALDALPRLSQLSHHIRRRLGQEWTGTRPLSAFPVFR